MSTAFKTYITVQVIISSICIGAGTHSYFIAVGVFTLAFSILWAIEEYSTKVK